MDLRELRLFVVVAEEGSIHAGARRLMITQPAVSQTLRKLERAVGGALMIRTFRGIELTPAGVALLEQAQDILHRMDALNSEVCRIARADNCLLRVGLMSGAASAGDLTFPILTAFRHRYPGVRQSVSDLSFANQFNALASGQVDVAIVRPPCDDERLQVAGLFSEPTILCFSNGHRLAGAEAVSLDDVLNERIVELVRAPGRGSVFPYREISGLALLCADVPRTRACVAEILGPLAAPGRRAAELRRTVRTYTAAHCSATTIAPAAELPQEHRPVPHPLRRTPPRAPDRVRRPQPGARAAGVPMAGRNRSRRVAGGRTARAPSWHTLRPPGCSSRPIECGRMLAGWA